MGLAKYQVYPDGITRWHPVSSLFARCSDTSCFVQKTAECHLAQKIIFSLPSHLWTRSTRSWWMITSLWRDTWVTVDNSHIIALAASQGRGTETSTHLPQVPAAGSSACHKFLVWPWTMHPASQHLMNPSFSPFLVLFILSNCTFHYVFYTGRRPSAIRPCSWVEIIRVARQKRSRREVRDFRQTFLFSSSNCCPWFASLIMVTFKSSCKVAGKKRKPS